MSTGVTQIKTIVKTHKIVVPNLKFNVTETSHES